MNAPQRKLLTILTISGAGLWISKEMKPTRKERVTWGVNGQLDHLNDTVEKRRGRAVGYAVPQSQGDGLVSRKKSDVYEGKREVQKRGIVEKDAWRSDYFGHEDAFLWWLTRE
ncbi:hypothetical protein ONS95_004298 [Cadophora gregata]|uniref:uncharacterized protein n=1 Tax=Cadophora gregata TaxID=51156 RepID=UPI0026DC38BE|nr:uncharacterized protein ONS95_004298 [Cadophora gregata]KAK0105319.1 hypothetical protein ONS96_004715 [Cadophora gregata f. sp. sojae]KAK0105780.1 hypothetical protein ONS95_004298 [Cadophora gregata]